MSIAVVSRPEPCLMVIFGATGDLTQRKLYPALVKLAAEGRLPEHFAVVAVGRREKTDIQVRKEASRAAAAAGAGPATIAGAEGLLQHIHYFQMDFDEEASYPRLRQRLAELDEVYNTRGNRIYFLAVAPQYFGPIADLLYQHGMTYQQGTWQRVVVEKPFGQDLASARQLNERLTRAFGERRVFRIDHYLGKEMLQNLMVIRFANTLFEPLWNGRFIEEVQISINETVGVEGRGGYYDGSGALRDMVQNHMLQLLTLTAMEPPVDLDADSIRDEKVKVLRSLRPIAPANLEASVVRGQYGPGTLDGKPAAGYRQEERVDPGSNTETYVALKLHIDNFRWSGVPFYLRTGKRLPVRSAEIVVRFREQPGVLYFGRTSSELGPNLLVVRIQPEEGVFLQFNARQPGSQGTIVPVRMDYCQNCGTGLNSPEAYERLLADVMRGDSTLFTRWDEVEYAWEFVDQIAGLWEQADTPVELYPAGSWGPPGADRLLAQSGHRWILPFQCLLTERPDVQVIGSGPMVERCQSRFPEAQVER
ncbi:MAG: glucose-6-phosphate dehydrogenase [Firmicutes bacterium]|jgi:glucose-6-phosphate 1-dehydrogenase|nr:glucose-6-phosphate dehydrogenase [Bacillota bacterium]